MSKYTDMMKALAAWDDDDPEFWDNRQSVVDAAVSDAYRAFKDTDVLVLESVDESTIPDDGSGDGRLDMDDEGTFFFNGKAYRLPEDKT